MPVSRNLGTTLDMFLIVVLVCDSRICDVDCHLPPPPAHLQDEGLCQTPVKAGVARHLHARPGGVGQAAVFQGVGAALGEMGGKVGILTW